MRLVLDGESQYGHVSDDRSGAGIEAWTTLDELDLETSGAIS